MAVGLPGMDRIRLADGHALLRRLAAHGRAHLFCGHVHLSISGSTGGVPWTLFKSPCHQAPLDLVSPDTDLSIDGTPGYGVILATADGIVAHHVDVPDTEPQVLHDPRSG